MEENSKMAVRPPKIALCNFFSDHDELKRFATANGFDGIDWSFALSDLPKTPADETQWAKDIQALYPFEVRYHCPFMQVDIGHEDPGRRAGAVDIFKRVIRLVSKVNGRFLSLHVGLGHDSMRMLSWEASIENLQGLVQYARNLGIRLCLENLAWGWTSKPNLFEKLIRRTGAGVTFDIGHARACESVRSQAYASEDFVIPHAERVFNAHVYDTEIEGVGHMPPERCEDIARRLQTLLQIGCRWWVIEIRNENELLFTKRLVDDCVAKLIRSEAAGAGHVVNG